MGSFVILTTNYCHNQQNNDFKRKSLPKKLRLTETSGVDSKSNTNQYKISVKIGKVLEISSKKELLDSALDFLRHLELNQCHGKIKITFVLSNFCVVTTHLCEKS
jgi:hypothetical protein